MTESRISGAEHPVEAGRRGHPDRRRLRSRRAGLRTPHVGWLSSPGSSGTPSTYGTGFRLIWAAAQAGQAPAYQARRIATATRHLSFEQAIWVDQQLAPSLGAVSWSRLQTLLEAAIYEADPAGAEQQAAAAAQERFVRLGRNSQHGLKLIIARATAGDAIWFKATVDRIADILARQGDTDPVDVRRSKAVGILAQPAEAVQLLYKHQDDDWDGPAEPSDLDEPTEDGSLLLVPPPIDPDRARPRAGRSCNAHLSAEALTASTGVARVEEVGPVLLGRLRALVGDRCSISLRPVIDLPAGHTPVDSYEIPASLRENLAASQPRRRLPLRCCGQPVYRC